MAQDTVDAAIFPVISNKNNNNTKSTTATPMKKVPSIEALNSEMPCRDLQKDRGKRAIKSLLNRLRLKKYACATISRPDPSYRVAYLGNVVTGWAKGEGCVEKPLATLWRNYTHSCRPDVKMQLTVSGGGLKATTKEHGLTEYWAHRLTTCAAPQQFPKLFCWVYRHEGRKLRHELRCHAVLCPSVAVAQQIDAQLKHSLALALAEFKKDKLSKQNARLSLVNSVYDNPTMPRRKILLSTGSQNYRPPLERSKSAPKLTSIEEIVEDEDIFGRSNQIYKKILKHYDTSTSLLEKRCQTIQSKLQEVENETPKCIENQRKTYKVTFESTESKPHLHDHISPTLEEVNADMILDELVQNSLSSDLVESCERAWYNALGEKPDLIPIDSDEGSLSSGCESSTSTALSDLDQPPIFPTISEEVNECNNNNRKTDFDFKVGGSVLARVRSFERISCNAKPILGHDEVSLIPVGESQSDFSSLKVFKRRSITDNGNNSNFVYSSDQTDGGNNLNRSTHEDDDAKSHCSDESGYDEEELTSTVANVVLV